MYDRWARHQRLFRLLATVAFAGREGELRSRSVGALRLNAGERVLDLACGPGVNVDRLAFPVGDDGEVVCVDYSAGMVGRARRRIERRDDDRATVVRGNAGSLPFRDGSFDAAYSSLSVSAMPNAEDALRETYRVLRPGGRVVVLDAQPYQDGPGRLLNPVVNRFSRWLTNWRPDLDVPALVDRVFDESRTETFNSGTFFVSVGQKG